MCSVLGMGIVALLFHNIKAGMPIVEEIIAKTAIVELNPKDEIPMPAAPPPKAVAIQIVALFFVASFPALFGDKW